MMAAREPRPEVSQPPLKRQSGAFTRLLRRPLAAASAAILSLLVVTAVLADVVGWRDPTMTFRRYELAAPMTVAPDGRRLILGADELGRDLFSRMVHGARISLFVSGLSALGAAAIGVALGVIAGYYSGVTDSLLLRVIDLFMAIPAMILAMVIATVLEAGLNGVVIAIVITYWPRVARVVRGDTLVVKEMEYVHAARAAGARDLLIIWRHILPNIVSSIIVMATTTMGAAVLIEAALAFLGIGAIPPTPSWGLMISNARQYLVRDPNLLLVPGIALSLAVLSLNLAGDALRDVLDPRMRGER